MSCNTLEITGGAHQNWTHEMYMRGNSFYADWRDSSGTRKRKSFSTATAAIRYENKQRLLRDVEATDLKKMRAEASQRARSSVKRTRPNATTPTTSTRQ